MKHMIYKMNKHIKGMLTDEKQWQHFHHLINRHHQDYCEKTKTNQMDKLSNLPSGGRSLLYLCSYLDPSLIIMVERRSGPGQGRAGRRILVHIESLILVMVALVGLIRHYWHVVVDGWLLGDKSKLCLIRHIVVGQCVELLPPSLWPGGCVLIIQNESTWKMKQ